MTYSEFRDAARVSCQGAALAVFMITSLYAATKIIDNTLGVLIASVDVPTTAVRQVCPQVARIGKLPSP